LPGDSPIEETWLNDRTASARRSKRSFLQNLKINSLRSPSEYSTSASPSTAQSFERIEKGAGSDHEKKHPNFNNETRRICHLPLGRELYRIALDLGSSLGSETFIIICVVGLVFRSVRIGLIAMTPNVFPLVICARLDENLTGQSLEIVTVCCFTICLGIAVRRPRSTFLTRFQEEMTRSASRKEAIRKNVSKPSEHRC